MLEKGFREKLPAGFLLATGYHPAAATYSSTRYASETNTSVSFFGGVACVLAAVQQHVTMDATMFITIVTALCSPLLLRTLFVLFHWDTIHKCEPVKTLIVLGSGGHTAEMSKLIPTLNPAHYSPLVYVAADTDITSEKTLKARGIMPADTQIHQIPRSREVGQSHVTAILTTIRAFFSCCALVLRLKPHLILCNGPGTCFPVCLAGILLRIVGLSEVRIVFVESICRVQGLSATGKLLYYTGIADQVQVQWPELAAKYPRSKYVGMLS